MKKSHIAISVSFIALAIFAVVPLVSTWNDEFDEEKYVRTRMDTLVSILEDYKGRNGFYPTDEADVSEFFSENGPDRNDIWGTPFYYRVRDDRILLYSFGPNASDDRGSGDDLMASESMAELISH